MQTESIYVIYRYDSVLSVKRRNGRLWIWIWIVLSIVRKPCYLGARVLPSQHASAWPVPKSMFYDMVVSTPPFLDMNRMKIKPPETKGSPYRPYKISSEVNQITQTIDNCTWPCYCDSWLMTMILWFMIHDDLMSCYGDK